jgi:hypothetical protein
MNPRERASSLLNNALYFCGDKAKAKECAQYFIQVILNENLKADDLVFWMLVKEELFKL